VDTLKKNDIVKRNYQHILNVARVLLFQVNLSQQFWCYVTKNVVI